MPTWKRTRRDRRSSGDVNEGTINTDKPGVYVIFGFDNNDEDRAVYVGKSDRSVYRRISDHCLDDEENDELREFVGGCTEYLRYWFLEVYDKEERSNFEYTLYYEYVRRYGKLFNKGPPKKGTRVPMELPF